MPFTNCRHCYCLLAALLVLALGSDSAQAHDWGIRPYPYDAPRPTPEDILLASNNGYQAPAGTQPECIGRLIFTTPAGLEWATDSQNVHGTLGLKLFHSGQTHLGEHSLLIVSVIEGVPKSRLRAELEKNKVDVNYETQVVHNKLQLAHSQQEDSRSTLQNLESGKLDPGEWSLTDAIASVKDSIASTDTEIRELQSRLDWLAHYRFDDYLFDIGRPDSAGYRKGKMFNAYLWKENRLVIIEQYALAEDTLSVAEHQATFDRRIRDFRFRKLHEIPRERGICFPYGFIADDGTEPFDIIGHFRLADAPGVVYELLTRTVDQRGPEWSEARAKNTANPPYGLTPDIKIVRRLGPLQTTIGALPAFQGGIALKVPRPGGTYDPYQIYTGVLGRAGSQVLPVIDFEMYGFTPYQDPAIKKEPPPFQQSLDRYNQIAQSIRLRPTEPLMPELENLAAQEPH